MAQPIAPNYDTVFLFPPAVEDWVPKDHPARFIRELVDTLDLPALGFTHPSGAEGRPPYATSLLLKIWLYGYLHHVRSTRRLEKACREHLSLIWLTGMLQPDHNSLWRFWRDNKMALRELFKRSVQVAVKAGLVGLALQAVDGTKIEAVASGYSGWSQEAMTQLLARLEPSLTQTETQVEQAQVQEVGEYRLPESLSERQHLREVVQAGLQELEQTQRQHYHPHEPEARRMVCSGRNRFGYNAQAAVDAQAGIVTAAAVGPQENDAGQLTPVLEQARENVGATATTHVADTGYGAAADMVQAQAAGFAVIAPVPGGPAAAAKPYHGSHFTYDRAQDVCGCPRGQTLTFEREKDRQGLLVRVFRCRHPDCPVRAQCTRDPRGRMIEISPYYEAVVAQRQALQDPVKRATFRRRGVIVEPVFGWIKQQFGFRRWTVRGLPNVRTQWSLLCLTVNLMKMLPLWRQGKLNMT